MSDLAEYYRQAMSGRVQELENALARHTDDPAGTAATIRRAAHSLRGSGGTYGFPEVSAAAGVVEDAADADLVRGTHSLLDVLRGISADPKPKAGILIVDDDPEIALLLRAVLAAPDRELVQAPSAAAAQTALQSRAFDIVILDLLLPDGDGRTVLRRMREAGSAAHVIMLSGKTASAVEAECRALGADVYMVKPFDPDIVAAHVTDHLTAMVRQ